MEKSEIVALKHGAVVFAGPDATQLFRAMTLRSALGLLKVGITPTRGLSMKKAMVMVGQYSGRTYKRTEVDQAVKDLTVWIETMKSALPVVHR